MATREEVEHNYSPSRWSHRMGPQEVLEYHVNTTRLASDRARASVECELDVPYGMGDREKVDIFGGKTLAGSAPIFIYIHGGYWQELGREVSAFMVPPLMRAGAVVAVLGYPLAPAAGMDSIVEQVRRGVAFVMNLAQRRGSRGVYLCGSSAGGHLAAMMLAHDWMAESMISPGLIKGALLVSGVYDVRPLVETYVNDPLGMTEADAWRNSPAAVVADIARHGQGRRLLLAYGAHDPPDFRRQSVEMHADLAHRNLDVRLVEVADTDHFNVIERLEDESYVLTKECVKMMGLDLENIDGDLKKTEI